MNKVYKLDNKKPLLRTTNPTGVSTKLQDNYIMLNSLCITTNSAFIPAGGAGCHAITANTAQNEKSALGSITKSCATPETKGLREIQVKRAERYALQDETVRLLPSERVRFCLKHRIDNAS